MWDFSSCPTHPFPSLAQTRVLFLAFISLVLISYLTQTERFPNHLPSPFPLSHPHPRHPVHALASVGNDQKTQSGCSRNGLKNTLNMTLEECELESTISFRIVVHHAIVDIYKVRIKARSYPWLTKENLIAVIRSMAALVRDQTQCCLGSQGSHTWVSGWPLGMIRAVWLPCPELE